MCGCKRDVVVPCKETADRSLETPFIHVDLARDLALGENLLFDEQHTDRDVAMLPRHLTSDPCKESIARGDDHNMDSSTRNK